MNTDDASGFVPTENEPHPLGVNRPTEREAPPTRDEFLPALDHILTYAEANGKLDDACTIVRRAYFAAANFGDGPAA